MKRGEIRWYQFPSPDKKRPVLILTRNSVMDLLHNVTVAPITSTIRDIPSEVVLSIDDGVPKDCAINFDNVKTISKSRVGALITTLSTQKLAEVREAIMFALDLDDVL